MELNKYKLSNLCDIQIGRTPPRAEKEWFNKKLHSDFTWVSIKDLGESVKYVNYSSETISLDGQKRFNIPIVKKGTVLLSFKLTVGRVGIAEKDMLTNEAIAQLPIVRKDLVDRDYLYYYLLNYNWNSLGSTSSIANAVNSSMIKNLYIEIPDIEIQLKVASVLSEIDNKIIVNTKLINNLQSQSEALYNEYFNIKFNNDYLEKGWSKTTLSSVTINLRNKCGDNNYKVFSALNTGVLVPSEDHFTKQVFSKKINNYIVVEPLDFAYNPARINIGSIGINEYDYIGCVSPVYVAFRVEKKYHYFFKFFIKSNQFKQETISRASGSVRQTLNYSDFGMIEINYPPEKIVDMFNDQYEIIQKSQNELIEENKKLVELRDTLLPKLMSGEIDVDKVEL